MIQVVIQQTIILLVSFLQMLPSGHNLATHMKYILVSAVCASDLSRFLEIQFMRFFKVCWGGENKDKSQFPYKAPFASFPIKMSVLSVSA